MVRGLKFRIRFTTCIKNNEIIGFSLFYAYTKSRFSHVVHDIRIISNECLKKKKKGIQMESIKQNSEGSSSL